MPPKGSRGGRKATVPLLPVDGGTGESTSKDVRSLRSKVGNKKQPQGSGKSPSDSPPRPETSTTKKRKGSVSDTLASPPPKKKPSAGNKITKQSTQRKSTQKGDETGGMTQTEKLADQEKFESLPPQKIKDAQKRFGFSDIHVIDSSESEVSMSDSDVMEPPDNVPYQIVRWEEGKLLKCESTNPSTDLVRDASTPVQVRRKSFDTKVEGVDPPKAFLRALQADPDFSDVGRFSTRKLKILPYSDQAPNRLPSMGSSTKAIPPVKSVKLDPYELGNEYFKYSVGISDRQIQSFTSLPFDIYECDHFMTKALPEAQARLGHFVVVGREDMSKFLDRLRNIHPLYMATAIDRARRFGHLPISAPVTEYDSEEEKHTPKERNTRKNKGTGKSKKKGKGKQKAQEDETNTYADDEEEEEEEEDLLLKNEGKMRRTGKWKPGGNIPADVGKGKIWAHTFHTRHTISPFPQSSPPNARKDNIYEPHVLTDVEAYDNAPNIKRGVNFRSLPPFITKHLDQALQWYYRTGEYILMEEADRYNISPRKLEYKARLKKIEDGETIDSYWKNNKLILDASQRLFGEYAVVGGNQEWATEVPQKPLFTESQEDDSSQPRRKTQPEKPSDRIRSDADHGASYTSLIQRVMYTLSQQVHKKEVERFRAVTDVDRQAIRDWDDISEQLYGDEPGNNVPIAEFESVIPNEEFADQLESLLRLRDRYFTLNVPLPVWIELLKTQFLKRATELLLLEGEKFSQLSLNIEREELLATINTIRGPLEGADDSFDREMVVQSLAEEQDIMSARAQNSTAMTDAFNQGLSQSILGTNDFGMARFHGMDHVDLIVYLGLERIQGSDFQRAKAADKAKSHEYEKDERGNAVRNEDGSIRWIYPELHALRTKINWPALNQWSNDPKDPDAWKTLCEINPGPKLLPTEQTHEYYQPKIHQITAVANMVARGFCQNDWSGENFATLLCDEVGLGKTWVPFLLATLLRYYRRTLARDPTFNPPVMDPWKVDFVLPQKNVSMTHSPPPPPSFIADRRLKLSSSDKGRIHVLLSDKTVGSVHLLEAKRLALEDVTIVCDYSRIPSSSLALRIDFWNTIDKHLALERDIFLLCSYGLLVSDAQLAPNPDSSSSSQTASWTLFAPHRKFYTLFADEFADLRNPETRTAFAVRRLIEKSGYAIGATATPIYTSAADLISLSRILGVESVVPRPTVNGLLPITTTAEAGDVPDGPYVILQKFDRVGLTPTAGNLLTLTKVLEAAARRALRMKAKEEEEGMEGVKKVQKLASTLHQLQKANPAPVWRSATSETAEEGTWEFAKKELENKVIKPLQTLLSSVIVRRDLQSKGPDGLRLTSVRYIEPDRIWVHLSKDERKAYKAFEGSLNRADRLFNVKVRRFLREPHGVQFSWYLPTDPIPSAVKKLCTMIRKILDEDIDKPDHLRRKIVVQTLWTGLIPFFQAHMCKYGIGTRTITGEIASTAQRAQIIREFQRDEDCVGECVQEFHKDSTEGRVWRLPCRTLIVSDVGSTGITLNRASEIFLLDPLWSFADTRQVIGRVNRMGQRFEVHAYMLVVSRTCEQRMVEVASGKAETFGQFVLNEKDPLFGKMDVSLEPQEDELVDEDALRAEVGKREVKLAKQVANQRQREIRALTKPRGKPDEFAQGTLREHAFWSDTDDSKAAKTGEQPASGVQPRKKPREKTSQRTSKKVFGYRNDPDTDVKNLKTLLTECQLDCHHPFDLSDAISLDHYLLKTRLGLMEEVYGAKIYPPGEDEDWDPDVKSVVNQRTCLLSIYFSQHPHFRGNATRIVSSVISPITGRLAGEYLQNPYGAALRQIFPKELVVQLESAVVYGDREENIHRWELPQDLRPTYSPMGFIITRILEAVGTFTEESQPFYDQVSNFDQFTKYGWLLANRLRLVAMRWMKKRNLNEEDLEVEDTGELSLIEDLYQSAYQILHHNPDRPELKYVHLSYLIVPFFDQNGIISVERINDPDIAALVEQFEATRPCQNLRTRVHVHSDTNINPHEDYIVKSSWNQWDRGIARMVEVDRKRKDEEQRQRKRAKKNKAVN
ncbi:hypothetical protein M231_06467 [Tremella mesenterica]|uniref:Helicase C-terminal domain-containing protein n=1 Tax=Tremella mesenterica TaxID=5217 RepID=A0A4Q1BE60_TREME|nr:hypothetical protein M231_06467 [Tremella mesenterica]